ncbi:MAG: KH domain-containing protein [Ruminococcaceae bacterium]|nr:KH domain-containing protein [Oscillospiraceae bacterium]
MEKKMITTGKTIELAIEAALQQLGLDRDSVSVQVLSQAKPGFLGFGATPARVEVTYEAPDPAPEAPKSALTSASRSKPKPTYVAPKKEEPKAEAPAPKAAKPAAPKAEKPAVKTEKPAPQPKVEKTYTPAEPGSMEEKIEVFLKGLLEHMGSAAVPHATKTDDDTYSVDLVGEDLGFLIGRRGDTLDAIQHLANYAINHGISGHIRINVDAEEYRQKREESLRRYAQKKAQQVLKAHRRTTLEPMNAYERHLIHAALQDMDRITTYSVGTEPNRRVVIEYVR